MLLLVIPSLLVPIIGALESEDTNLKAASFRVNCNCQCSNLQFRDKYGRKQGNCQTADNTGAVWCYVDSAYSSSCQDLKHSTRYKQQGKAWSYEACATPSRFSAQCSGSHGGTSGGGIGGGICRGSSCGGGSGGFGGSSGGYGTGGGNSNCRHGQNCNVGGASGGFGSGGSSSNCRHGQNCNFAVGGSTGNFGSGGSVSNCRHGQNCNVGVGGSNGGFGGSQGNFGGSQGGFGNSQGGFGGSSGGFNSGSSGFNPYAGSSGGSTLGGILQGRKSTKDKVNLQEKKTNHQAVNFGK